MSTLKVGEIKHENFTGTTQLKLDNSGRVLIGHSSNFSGYTLQVSGGDEETSSLSLSRFKANASSSVLEFNKSRNNSVGSNTVVQDNDAVGVIRFKAADGTDYAQVADIQAAIDGTPGDNDTPGRLAFSTTADGSQYTTERMRIDSSGKVGIGTSSPSQHLHIETNTNGDERVLVKNPNTGSSARAAIKMESDSSTLDMVATSAAYSGVSGWNDAGVLTTGSGTSGGLIFNSQASSSAIKFQTQAAERMRIDSTGKVGLGTTSPVTAMHIANADDPVTITLQNTDSNTPTGSGGEILFKGTKTNGDPIFFGGIGGRRRNQASDVTGYLALYRQDGDGSNAAVEAMRIDHNGNIGIGTTSPQRQLHIVGNDGATGATLGNSDTCLVLDNQQSNGAIMEFLSDNNGAGRIMFTDTDASNQGKIQYFHNNDFFQVEVATSSQSTMALHLTKQNAANNVQSDMIAFDVGGSGRGKIVSAHSGSSSPQFSTYSDRRLKTNIKDYTGGYEKIKSLKIRIYDEISNDDTKSIIGDIPAKNVIGYIADEFQEVFPQEVRGTKDEIDSDGKPVYQSISDTFLTPYLVQALQEAVSKIEVLETKVAALEAA